jgi:hypothetical protein
MKRKRQHFDNEHAVWLQFRMCAANCFRPECHQCGYFWGPDHRLAGTPAHFGLESAGTEPEEGT